jgi:hypothetical protein
MAGYVIPDEPRGAVRPDLAVRALWPFLVLMISGPLPGFAWFAFNAWALGCRDAARQCGAAALGYLLAKAMIVWLAMAPASFAALAGSLGLPTMLAVKLMLIACAGGAMALAYAISRRQSHNEEYREVYGPELADGRKVFFLLLLFTFFGLSRMPSEVALLWHWTLL